MSTSIRSALASEFGFLFGPTMRRYGVVIVPTIVSTIAAVDIINNAQHRHLLEKYCPSFVDLVRRYHGFADEDGDEIRRVRCVEKQLGSPVTVAFCSRLLDSPKIYIDVDASQSVDSLVDFVIADSGLQGVDREVALRELLFPDAIDESDREDVTTSGHRTIDHKGNIALSVLGTHASLYSASVPAWDGLANRRPLTTYSLPLINETHPGLHSTIDSREVGNRYDDFLSDFLAGLTTFESCGFINIPVKGAIASKPKQGNRSRIRMTDGRQHNDSLRLIALQRISTLEREILDLEREKLGGRREIDSIEQDIATRRTTITDLRRRHINYFYYF